MNDVVVRDVKAVKAPESPRLLAHTVCVPPGLPEGWRKVRAREVAREMRMFVRASRAMCRSMTPLKGFTPPAARRRLLACAPSRSPVLLCLRTVPPGRRCAKRSSP